MREANKAGSTAVAKRIEGIINEMARDGWDYGHYDAIATTVNPGCPANFSGPRTVYFGTLTFSRTVVPERSQMPKR